ncbi:MAG: toll/interleukin-1 receptor domain-containing protein [Lachnospiraceae bacterium]|nr:toll/interleukin-1 receptor domain-containing protein [Lachnospiraceae bacterium]
MDENKIKTLIEQLDGLIELGERALKEDYHKNSKPDVTIPDFISGDINNEWLAKSKIYCKRYISDFPLQDEMLELIDEQNAIPVRAKKLLADLKTLKDDKEYWESKAVNQENDDKANNTPKPHKIFISHNTVDKDYAEAFVGLLEDLGLYQDEIICSSVPPYCIPLDNKVFDWLANEFQKSDLHMIFLLSKNYYGSPASLNEMGAAWAIKHKWTGILLPGFGFDEVKGCIDKTQVSIKLDDPDVNTLEFRLSELKDNLIKEFDLRDMPEPVWKRKRDDFLDKVKKITEERAKAAEQGNSDKKTEEKTGNSQTVSISKEAAIMLVYVAAVDNSDIMILPMMGGSVIQGGNYTFNQRGNMRDEATWESAVEELYNYGLIRRTGKRDRIYQLTRAGFEAADKIKAENNIDTSKNPAEYLD